MKLEIFRLKNTEKKIYKKLNYFKEIKLRDLPFEINNPILVTNSLLIKIKKKDVLIAIKKRKPFYIYFSIVRKLYNFGII